MKKTYRITFIVLAVITAFLGVWLPPMFVLTALCVYLAINTEKYLEKREATRRAGQALQNVTINPVYGDPKDALKAKSFVVLDTETTGLDPKEERIIEIAMIHVEEGKVIEEKNTFVNPGRKVPKKITELTGITTADVKTGISQQEAAVLISDFIGDLPIVAHNAPFDAKFVAYTLARAGIEKPIRYIDTLQIARNIFPGRSTYKLKDLSSDLDLVAYEQTHRALDDARMVHALFLRCADELPGQG